MIQEGTRVLLVDAGGKKVQFVAADKMIEVGGLGVVDGSRVCSSSFGDTIQVGGREFLLLKPSVRDIIGIIQRRAQIIIPKDSFQIPLHLDLGCGSTVIEGGVGSGALAVVLLKAVGPSGKVYSFDTRNDHADLAKKNVAMAENSACWELRIEDICTADLPKDVDAAVLDIPNPWDALDNISAAVRIGGHVCCYVPNANQLNDCVRKMRDAGLGEVTSFETLQREMIVHDGGVRPSFEMLGHTGYLAFGRKMKK
jgi:tRNA (adenine57-N1/adenine58-N1)-methyltransferase